MKSCWNLRLSNYVVFVLALTVSSSMAQFSAPEDHLDKVSNNASNYLFPVEPGTPNLLAGTMGELRSNHFHSGIDVRTNGRIGVPILSAQQGYVSRISISTGGYGNALYITHPNGHTTVYGHLDRFEKRIADFVRKEQYRKKSFDINLYLKPGTFDVARGDTVAFSGNSGGSSGPHLHFDIRDKNNEALNPLLFNFGEVVDNTPPVVRKIALRTMDINSRINDQFGRFEFYVTEVDGNYKLPYPILASGTIGVELLGYDRLDNSRSQCGINLIEMYAGNDRIFKQEIDKVNFGDTRNILTLMDYTTLKTSGERFNKLYIDDGNILSYYGGSTGKGMITVKAEDIPIRIALKDAYGNESFVNLSLKASEPAKEVVAMTSANKLLSYKVIENILEVTSKRELGDSIVAYFGKNIEYAANTYSGKNQHVFLFDLRKKLPDSIRAGNQIINTHFKDMIPSGIAYKYYSDLMDINFSKNSLYDTVFLRVQYKNKDREVFSIGDSIYPINSSLTITLKPKGNYSERFSVYRNTGRYFQYMGGSWANGKITFSTREFGDFVLLEDTNAPSIIKMAVNGAAARFKIRDDLSGISYYEATINGEWLLMNYDYKTNMIWAERKDSKVPLKGDLSVKVVDYAGNENIYQEKIP
ncbi:MAG TPA: M23 family peptidase [Cytophagales bacterium]|nr:M23 family peptidase [Cytophagales bacterium]